MNLKPISIGPAEDPYIHRWMLFSKRNPLSQLFNVYLHRMMHDDDDRALHDHPYANISIILRGGYLETFFVVRPEEGAPLPPKSMFTAQRRPGHVIFRRAETAHMLALPPRVNESWSLFFTGRRKREWGFWTRTIEGLAAWVHWKEFV